MKLRPITRDDSVLATSLLAEGFPALAETTWKDSLTRIFDYVERRGEHSIGSIVTASRGDLGICLAIPAERHGFAQPPSTVINLACFYMRPGEEWRTPLVLKRLMAQTSATYLDLTASPVMRELNRKIGFVDQARGMVIVPLLPAALRPSPHVRIHTLGSTAAAQLDTRLRDLLAAHEALGCVALLVEWQAALHPVILAAGRRKGVAGARVILAPSRALLRDAAGALARHLLARGYLFMDFDGDSKDGFPPSLFWTRSPPVQVLGAHDAETIDLTFSELVFIPPAGLLNGA